MGLTQAHPNYGNILGYMCFNLFLKVRISESDSDSDHLYDHVPVKDQLEMLKHLPEGVSIVKLSVPVECIGCHGGSTG